MSITPTSMTPSAVAQAQAEDIAARLEALVSTLTDASLRSRIAYDISPWTGVGRAELDERLTCSDRATAEIVSDIRTVVQGLRRS